MAEPDRDLVAAVDALPRVPLTATAYRHLGPGYSVTSGEGARMRGGRWNPPESFPVLYLGLSEDAVRAEFYRLADKQGMPAENLLPRRFQRYEVKLQALLDLRDPRTLSAFGIDDDMLRSDDPAACQVVGDTAHGAGFEGIIAPSATGRGEILAVFTDMMRPGSTVSPGSATLWKPLP